jgi:hypothetical protein
MQSKYNSILIIDLDVSKSEKINKLTASVPVTSHMDRNINFLRKQLKSTIQQSLKEEIKKQIKNEEYKRIEHEYHSANNYMRVLKNQINMIKSDKLRNIIQKELDIEKSKYNNLKFALHHLMSDLIRNKVDVFSCNGKPAKYKNGKLVPCITPKIIKKYTPNNLKKTINTLRNNLKCMSPVVVKILRSQIEKSEKNVEDFSKTLHDFLIIAVQGIDQEDCEDDQKDDKTTTEDDPGKKD